MIDERKHLKLRHVGSSHYRSQSEIIGGIATVLHGVPRATFDLDVLIEARPENA